MTRKLTPDERRMMEIALKGMEAEAELDEIYNKPAPKDFLVGGAVSARQAAEALRKSLAEDDVLPG